LDSPFAPVLIPARCGGRARHPRAEYCRFLNPTPFRGADRPLFRWWN